LSSWTSASAPSPPRRTCSPSEELRNEIQGVREELRAEIQGVREEVHKLDARLSGVEARLGSMQWLLGLIFAGIVALIFRVFLFGG